MANIRISDRIDAPPERVFDLFTDLHGGPDRLRPVKRIEVLTDGPIGKGTRWRETRIMMKRECTETLEITEFDPPSAYTAVCDSHGSVWTSEFRFKPDGAGTRIDLTMRCSPVSLCARLMSPISSLFAGVLRKAIQEDIDDLRAAAAPPGEAATA